MWFYLGYHKGKCYPVLFDSGMREILLAYLLQHTKDMFIPIYKISFPVTGLFLLGLDENSCQEWTTLGMKETFNSFLLNIARKEYCRNICM
jgi:hypothetical protein